MKNFRISSSITKFLRDEMAESVSSFFLSGQLVVVVSSEGFTGRG